MAVAIAGCLLVVRSAAVYGVSRALLTYSLTTGNVAGARKATELTPKDAETHFAHAAVLSLIGANTESVAELENAVALRPADYGLWLELGLLRDQAGDAAGAIGAFDAAIARAPHYSKPRWQRGNVLLRSGQIEAGFKDLNTAALSDPDLVPSLIDLAWGISRGDVALAEQLAEINNNKKRLVFAKTLIRTGKFSQAVDQARMISDLPEANRRELVNQLLAKNAFKEAFTVWTGNKDGAAVEPAIFDGGFEGALSFGTTGFGWRLPQNLQAASIYLSSNKPHTGTKNLTVEYSGYAGGGMLSQIIPVEPSSHYQISFASRSDDIVSGGLPVLVVQNASDAKHLAQSPALPSGTTDWKTFSFDFTTTPQTSAVVLSLERESCTSGACPVFGSLSLDSFSVAKLK
ncbi:MAG TPA: carbohydrate binding domain-containing protein [Pyrinomonadaceae bacterium]|nr:carbohydrate binding domain-containing protein [Pyrinomonadaceae bacterium]